MSRPAIVIDSNQEEIEKLKRKWQKVKYVGNGIQIFGETGFIGSLLSPLDIEGPVVEILTGAAALGGFITKKVADNHLRELEGQTATWTEEDKEQVNRIRKDFVESMKNKRSTIR